MRRIRPVLSFVPAALVLMVLSPATAVPQHREGPSGQQALGYVRVLAGDAFESRMAGLEGGRRAGAWIADRFTEWGLEPGGTNGFFQDFKKAVFHVQSASFSIEAGKTVRTFAYDQEWRVCPYSGSASVRGELVFAGFGIVSEKDGWNEFAGLDLRDKIVLMIPYGAPSFLAGVMGPETMPEAKIAKACELGARAVIMMNMPVDVLTGFQHYPFPAGVIIEPAHFRPDIAVAGINDDAVKAIFRNTGIDLYARVQQMEKDKKPGSESLGIQAAIQTRTVYLPEASLRNVLAKITGSDRTLRQEFVVIGAHYDGLGLNPDGRMNPGADDNASGTAVVMEVARVMKLEKARPKRTVVFALWDGEEQGLWGSIYYGQHPVCSLDKTLANLNLDMVGNGDGGLQFRGVYYAPEIWTRLKAELPPEVLEGVVPTRGGPGGSDHTPFLVNGVPGFFIQTTGPHYGHHDVGDMTSLVQAPLLEKTGDFLEAAVTVLADAKDLRPATNGRELNLLRSSTLVDLAPQDAAPLLKSAEAVEYPDLDFALVSVPGASPMELAGGFYSLTAAVQAAKKAVLYQPPSSPFSIQRLGDRVCVLPGIPDLAALGGRDEMLRLLGRAGLGYVVVRDRDFARGDEEMKRMVAAANAEGVLIIAWETNTANSGKLVAWSTRPGLSVTAVPDAGVLKAITPKKWRLALDVKAGEPPEACAADVRKLAKELGARSLLLRLRPLAVKGFDPALIGLARALGPEEMTESQMMSGGLDEFGQNLIYLLRELR
jgi:hypothetical protein